MPWILSVFAGLHYKFGKNLFLKYIVYQIITNKTILFY